MEQTARQQSIVLALQSEGWLRAEDLAAAHGVSPRTIYRDIRTLHEAGVPVRAVPGRGYRLYEGYVMPPLLLTADEAVVSLLGSGYLARHADARLRSAAQTASAKIAEVLPARLREEVASLREQVRLVPAQAFDGASLTLPVLDRLRQAVAAQRCVRLRLAPSGDGEEVAMTLSPYGVVGRSGAWHVVGHCVGQEGVRHLRLRDVAAVELLDEAFERPAGYGPAPAVGAAASVTARVWMATTVAEWAHVGAPEVVETEAGADGVVLTLRVEREADLVPWVLGWGRHARVLAPASLQRRVAEEAEHVAGHYAGEKLLL